jgi:glycerophosphoryl diester phosphodiesterase
MALPAEYDLVRVFRKYVYFDGTFPTGTVDFTGKVRMRASVSGDTLLPKTISVKLENGVLDEEIPATDDPQVTPNGWTYTVKENFKEGGGETYEIDVPLSAKETGLDLGQVEIRPPSQGDPTAFVTLSAFNDAIRNVEVAGRDLFAETTGTQYIAHRLGGGRVAPENSLEAAELITVAGLWYESDTYSLYDGTMVVMHDPTTGRTCTVDEPVSSFDNFSWRGLRFKPAFPGTTPRDEAPPFFLDLLDKYGGKQPMLIESKDSLETAQKMIAEIVKRGLNRSVMMTSFDQTHLDLAVAEGIPTMLNDNAPDIVAIQDKGYEWVSITKGVITPTLVQELHDNGMKVSAYTVDTRTDRDALVAMGVDAIVTEEPYYVPYDTGRLVDPYKSGYGPIGHVQTRPQTDNPSEADMGYVEPSTGSFGWNGTSQKAITLGWACPINSPNYKVKFKVEFQPGAVSQTAFAALYVCMADDRGITEASSGSNRGNGYSLTVRRDGTCGFYKVTAGVAVKLKDGWTTSPVPITADISSAGYAWVEAEVSATTIFWRRLNDDGTVMGTFNSNTTDTTYRGGRYIGLSFGNTPVKFNNFTITPIFA